jgi:hypothetical protein
MKRFFLVFFSAILLNFTGCGSNSNNDEREALLKHTLQLVGIPPELVVNICQDDNDNGSCDVGELQAKIKVGSNDTIAQMWKKVEFDTDGRYILENYDKTKNIIMEIEDAKNLKYDNHKLGLKYNPDTEELSVLQALIDADLLKEEDTKDFKALNSRDNVDKILLDSLRENQNLLKDEKLSTQNALSLNLGEIAKGLITLDISKNLPQQLNACNGNQECIDRIIKNTTEAVKLTQEEARLLAQSKKIVDGYILKLSTPITAVCNNGEEYLSLVKVGKEGKINFEKLPTNLDCNITVPRGATIDSNNNGKLDNSDIVLNFDMLSSNDTTYITPLTTLLFKKRLKGENVDKFAQMIQNFDPVTAPNRVLTNTGIEKVKIEKLIILMEVLKTSMKQFASIVDIDLSGVIFTGSNETMERLDINKLIAKLPSDIQRSVKERVDIIKELLRILKDLDTSKISLNTLFICVSDGGKSISDAIREALLVALPEGVNPLDFIIKINTSVTDNQPIGNQEDIKNRLEIINTPPVAKIDGNKTLLLNETVTVDGSKSSDSDGNIVSYRWILNDKTVGTDSSIVIKDLTVGVHILTLIVKDNKGAINSDKTTITINPLPDNRNNNQRPILNKLPIADAGVNQIVELGTVINLDATGSRDEDGEILIYQWKEKDRVLSNEKTFSYNFDAGEHLVTLIVTDDKNATAEDKVNIKIYTPSNLTAPDNLLPQIIANAGINQTVKQKQPVTLNALNSVGNIAHYSWTENESILSEYQSFTISELAIGEHHIMLTVTSHDGSKSTDMVVIEILNIIPTAILHVSETETFFGTNIDFNASESYDTYGNITEYEWRDGDNILSNSIYFSESNLSVGQHIITLTVTDNSGGTHSSSIHINIKALILGSIIGVIKDFNTGNYLQDINITLRTTEERFIQNSLSDKNGTYNFHNLHTDINYSISFEKDGYMVVLYELIHLEENELKRLEAIKLLIDNNSSEDINLTTSGKIINAVSGDPLNDVNLSIRKNIENRTGDIIATATTDNTGKYILELPYGIYTAEAKKDGFTTSYFTITVVTSETQREGETSLSPLVNINQMRIILRWGATPSDLDSHLIRKTNGVQDYHIYFQNKQGADAILDHDDTSSYGPETTTIDKPKTSSIYTYFIHNYSGVSKDYLKNSNAKVEIISKNIQRTFNVPNEQGMYWKVFDIINGKIVLCNENCVQDSYQESSSQEVSDQVRSTMQKVRNINEISNLLEDLPTK